MIVVVIVVVVIVVVVVLVGRARAGARPAHALGAAALRGGRAAAARLVAAAALLELVGLVAGEDDRHVRRALAHPEVTTAGARLARLAGRAFVAPDARDEQLVGRELLVVLGVRDRRVEQLQHVVGRVLLAELEHADRVVDRQAAHEVEHLADLVRRDRQVADGRASRWGCRIVDGHQRRLDRSCPAWYRNVRVGANSPSL